MNWLCQNNSNNNGIIDPLDMLSVAVTCAMVPLFSRVLILIWGDNPIWADDRLFSVYFAVFSGRVLMEKLQSVLERRGLKDEGYTFMDFDVTGKVVYTFPVLLTLFCWNSAVAMLALLLIFFAAALILCVDRCKLKFDVCNTSRIGLSAILLSILANVYLSFADINYPQDAAFAIFVVFLVTVIASNAFRDYLRVNKKGDS